MANIEELQNTLNTLNQQANEVNNLINDLRVRPLTADNYNQLTDLAIRRQNLWNQITIATIQLAERRNNPVNPANADQIGGSRKRRKHRKSKRMQ